MKLSSVLQLLAGLSAHAAAKEHRSAPARGEVGLLRASIPSYSPTSVYPTYSPSELTPLAGQPTLDPLAGQLTLDPLAGDDDWFSSGDTCEDGEEKCNGWWCQPKEWACCDWETEETCYDENWNPASCASYESGGCPCEEGEAKCNGWCQAVCCDEETEDTCYDENYDAASCVPSGDDCPCPDGEASCHGYCEQVCCDWETEETCYDDDWEPTECKLWSEGGCPCAEGEVKCDGWCQPEPQDVCCDYPTEYACYDYDNGDWKATSCVPASESCPSSGQAQGHHRMSKLITSRGTPEEIASFRSLKTKHHKLSARGGANPTSSAKHAVEHEMMALARTVKLRGGLQKGTPSAKFDKAKGTAQNYHYMSELITSRGTPKEIANFRHLERKYHKLSADGGKAPAGRAKRVVEHEMMALARAVELRGGLQKGGPFAKNEQISFA